jgi:hypothetical protein
MICCENPRFQQIEELGHAESVDWDLKQYLGCGSYILQESSEAENAGVYCTLLREEQARQFRQSQGRERMELLKKWYNEH